MGLILLAQNARDAQLYIARCGQCINFKSRPKKAVIGSIKTTHPLQLVHLDYLVIKVTEGGKDVDVLVIVDYVMQYVQALETSSQSAKCTVQALWD